MTAASFPENHLIHAATKFASCLVKTACALSFSSGAIAHESSNPHILKRPLALVYAGQGVCVEDGCETAAAEVARARGFRVKYVKAAEVTERLVSNARLWIQPGGNAIQVAHALGERRMSLIRRFVQRGGRYLGFCAGGFFADRVIDDRASKVPLKGLGIIGSDSYEYATTNAAMLIPVRWLGQLRTMYFQGGPAFRLKSPVIADLIAFYPDRSVAAIIENFGRGRAAVTGPHPEAPQWWFDAGDLQKNDGLDFDFAVALLDRLMTSPD